MGAEHLNRRGRPKGSKNRLSEDFLANLADDFSLHGKAAIVKVREEDATAYLKIVASLMPKDVNAATEGDLRITWMTTDQLETHIRNIDGEIDAMRLEEKKAKLIEVLPHEITLVDTGVPRGPDHGGAEITHGPSNPIPSAQYPTYAIDWIGENDQLES